MALIPPSWMPDARMKRIVCHWTAGGYRASPAEREHYHILIERDGTLVRGTHGIRDNESTADGVYAKHTRGLNGGAIGVAVCCMAEAEERPFDAGRFPMTQVQWARMAEVAAELCRRYAIPVTRRTVLGHGEVQRVLGVAQRGKWDPMVLPWEPRTPPGVVGDRFRRRVADQIARPSTSDGPDVGPPDLRPPPKPWYESRTVWGGIVAILSPLLAQALPSLGAGGTADAAKLLELLGPLVGGVLAVLGRVSARAPIGPVR